MLYLNLFREDEFQKYHILFYLFFGNVLATIFYVINAAWIGYLGYDKYFMLNGKKLKVENVDLNGINDKMKSGGIKRIFAKSMKNRLQSRTLLNKFIEEVA